MTPEGCTWPFTGVVFAAALEKPAPKDAVAVMQIVKATAATVEILKIRMRLFALHNKRWEINLIFLFAHPDSVYGVSRSRLNSFLNEDSRIEQRKYHDVSRNCLILANLAEKSFRSSS
jgi:hypothetical protein